jgi:hypothetical protein
VRIARARIGHALIALGAFIDSCTEPSETRKRASVHTV